MVASKLPKEIKRPMRGLDELPHWKATEYRSFLLYLSVVVTKTFFESEEIFEHFLHYFCAITICSRHDQLKQNLDIARQILLRFLEGLKIIYGKHLFTSNMHNLCHLLDDVQRFGPLDSFSAYPFESKLWYLKNLIRSGRMPLSQIANRLTEIQDNYFLLKCEEKKNPTLKRKIYDYDGLDEVIELYLKRNNNVSLYSLLELDYYCLNARNDADRWILTHKFQIFLVEYISYNLNDNSIRLWGRTLTNIYDYFSSPVPSSSLQIFATDMQTDRIHSISKMVKIIIKQNFALMLPLLHTLI